MTTPQEAVAAVNGRFGRHEGYRALHAKGTLCTGTFTATPEAARLTRAAHMQGSPVRATVRVSNGGGDPGVPDYEPDVRGLAVKLYLPDGTRTDISTQTAERFITPTPDGFVELMRANTGGASQAWKMPLFLARHPRTIPALPAFLAALKPPASYATRTYYAIHSFRWVDAEGGSRYVRYRFVPEAGDATLGLRDARRRGRDYLREELVARLERGPIRFTLEVQIAAGGDPVDDPTQPWHADRETVAAGTLELTGLEHDREGPGDVLVFDPTRVTDGIELSDDPVLRFRTRAYSESIEQRSGVGRGADAPPL
jgi:catalase